VTCPSRTILRPDLTYIEDAGIPPDVYVEATEADFAGGIDPVLEYAFEELGAQRP
jgi:C-terminal processing protease CtpA/Prc